MSQFNAVIVGVGSTEYSLDSKRSVLSLAIEACHNAMEDAGMTAEDVDGLLEFNMGDAPRTQAIAGGLGLPVLNYGVDYDAAGYYASAMVATAAMAVDAGLAKAALAVRAMNGRSGIRWGGGAGGDLFRPKGAAQYRVPYGWLTWGQQMAMACRRHMETYGTKPEHLAAIAINQRNNAMLNERAVHREPLTLDQYMGARLIADPFHLYDMCLETDGACAVLVTSRDRAKDCRKKMVFIEAGGYICKGYPDDPFLIDSLHWEDLTENFTRPLSARLYKQAGIGPKDIDVAEIYDCFTYTVLMGLEGLGFCAKGEGGPFAASGAIALNGSIPINTQGGMLSEAYIHGMNVIAEAVFQLRGECGALQVPNAELAITTSGAGCFGSGLILRS